MIELHNAPASSPLRGRMPAGQVGVLKLHLHRYRHTPYGIDGYLEISGRQVGNTTEHPLARLPPGEYQITLERPILKRGNGPFRNLDGSICVGRSHCTGCVINSAATYQTIYDRIQKSLKRGTPVTLVIE